MKLSIRTLAFTVAIAALCMPTADARGRNNVDHNNQRTEKRKEAPSHNGNHNQSKRPNNGNQRPSQNSRPNNNGNHRPDNNRRPNNSHQGNNPPGNINHGQRPPQPNVNHGPQHSHNNQFAHTPPPPMRPPHRPNMPAHRPWQRPTPPPSFRPAPGWTPFTTILGVTIGSAVNLSINALINSGYNVTGYGNDAVYVANAPMLNMMWPDATLYYNNGGLHASEFVYSTPVYNMSRYNTTYRALVRNYGNPVSSTNVGGVITTTWWGPGGQFINLSFQNAIAGNGSPRFFTTLSFGN